MDAHRAAFVAEAEDGITDLNNALLALEADPADDTAMDDVFRVAHTLKGNAAAMGYDDVSSFGHALEDLLDAIRRGEREVTPEVMDLLFEGVDVVEAMVAEIDADGTVRTDPTDVAARLREVEEHGAVGAGSADDAGGGDAGEGNEAGDGDAEGDEAGGGDAEGDEAGGGDAKGDEVNDAGDESAPPLPDAAAVLDGDAVVYADVTIGETAMPGVDATFVMQALEGAFDGYVTDPDPEMLEAGEYDEGFEVFVAADDPAAVAETLESLTQVDAVDTTRIGEGESEEEGATEPEATEEATEPETTEESVVEQPGDESVGEADEKSAVEADETGGSDGSPAASKRNGNGRDEIKSIRVDVDQVDELYGLVEQLVTSRIKLRRELEEAEMASDSLDELDKLASSLQDTAMDMRLIPFSQVSDSFPRLVRDIARDMDKQVRFDIEGDDVELDRTILTEMRDPLVHVLRNAVDHGIETPGTREAAGKEPTGHVLLRAQRDRDHVVIEVTDDGAGLDPEALREKAVREGVESRDAVEAMTDDEVYDLVFHPGFSTAEEVTDVSGRGVGMDVVRTTARDLDGSVAITSEPGEGSTIRFRLPVTVAIVKVMFVDVGGTEYGIPIKSIAEVSRANDVEEVHGREIVRHEDDLYPVIRLGERLETGPGGTGRRTGGPSEPADAGEAGDPEETGSPAVADGGAAEPDATDADAVAVDAGMLVRIREETRQVALHCDAVLDQEEVVVKPLDGPLSGTPGLSGTAVLGDGDVVGVLDVVSL